VANSCTTTFKTAGFIVSDTANGVPFTIPTQVAGVTSPIYYLRAVRSGNTKACEAALTSPTSVNFANECNNPAACSSGNLMGINGDPNTVGSVATPIAGNANGFHTSSTAVTMNFDVNGSAPFTLNYADVGQVTLWATKAASGTLLTTLTGSTNPFVVRPYSFSVTNIKRTADNTVVPTPASPLFNTTKFVRAGNGIPSTTGILTQFTATVTALANGGAATPNFGKEAVPESVKLKPTKASDTALSSDGVMYLNGVTDGATNAVVPGSTFTSGIATPAQLAWSETGLMFLTPSLNSGNYLGSGAVDVTGTATANIGRFYPTTFVLTTGSIGNKCAPTASGNFAYMGQSMALNTTIEARNSAGSKTSNYNGAYAKALATYAAENLNNGTDLSSRLTVSPAGTWSTGTFTLNSSNAAVFSRPTTVIPDATWGSYESVLFGIKLTDSDADANGPVLSALDMDPASSSTSCGATCSYKIIDTTTTALRNGRARLLNANGSELLDLQVPFTVEYWSAGQGWQRSTTDACTGVDATNAVTIALSGPQQPNTCVRDSGTGTGLNGRGESDATCAAAGPTPKLYHDANSGAATFIGNFNLWLKAPGAGNSGFVTVTSTVPSWLRFAWVNSIRSSPTARATFGVVRSGPVIYRREGY
jgi:MSHA biogenesis protein MshQ